jgi:hypothetical protein
MTRRKSSKNIGVSTQKPKLVHEPHQDRGDAYDLKSLPNVQGPTEPDGNPREVTTDRTGAASNDLRRWSKWTAIGTVAMAVASFALAAVSGWQLRRVGDQIKMGREQLDLTRRSFQLAYGAELSADDSSLDGFDLTAGTDFEHRIQIINIGHHTATAVTGMFDCEIPELTDGKVFRLRKTFVQGSTIAEGGKWGVFVGLGADQVTPAVLQGLAQGKLHLRAYGVVIYWDGFCRRCASFCFGFIAPETWPGGQRLEGNPTFCRRVPDCSRFGTFATDSCPQHDVGDKLGYFPETVETDMDSTGYGGRY